MTAKPTRTAILCCFGLLAASSLPIGAPTENEGMILGALTAPLRLVQNEAIAQETPGEVSTDHVQQAISDLISEIEVLREAMGVADYPLEADPAEDRAPIHVYAKTLEVQRKISAAQRKLGMTPAKTGQIPVKPIGARDVHESVHVAIGEVRRMKEQLFIDDAISPAPLGSGGDASILYQLMGDASYLLDGLVGRPTDMNDVYRSLLHVLDDMELVAAELQVALALEPAPPAERKRLNEVAQQVLRGTFKIISLQTRLGMDASGVPQVTLVRVSPAQLNEAVDILSAEMVRIKAHLGITAPREERARVANKRPRDAFAMALLLIENMDRLAGASADRVARAGVPEPSQEASEPSEAVQRTAGEVQRTAEEVREPSGEVRETTEEVRTSVAVVEQPGVEVVRGSVSADTRWRAGRTYALDGVVFVEAGARLTIEPGVSVLGGPGAALVVTRDASVLARGNPQAPIVFTSARPAGERRSGDWGGVVLLGNAPINRGTATVEGISEGEKGIFGGDDPASNCGVLEYVRIEFAGYAVGRNNELNGLTLGGCGSGTFIDHVQVHRGHDDGIEVFGGNVDLKHIIVSHARDDSLDWDMGWTGRTQFLIVAQHPDVGDSGFEGDNGKQDLSAEPVSRPRIYNATMVGSRNPDRSQRAMVIRNGSGGEFRNFLIVGFPLEAIDLRGELTGERVTSNLLSFGSMAMGMIGPDGETFFADESGERDDDGGFDELRYFSETAPNVLLGVTEALGPDAFSLNAPNFALAVEAFGAGSAHSPPVDEEEFWTEGARYFGAVPHGEQRNWTSGWTAYPEG